MSGWLWCALVRDGGDGCVDGSPMTDDGGLGNCMIGLGCSTGVVDNVASFDGLGALDRS